MPDTDVTPEEMMSLVKSAPKPYVLLNFFATWCAPCRREMPDLVALQKDSTALVDVKLISVDRPNVSAADLRSFLADFDVDFQTYAAQSDPGKFIAQFYGIWNDEIPLSLIYSKEGRMVEALAGLTDRAEIEMIVNLHSKMGN
jgi:thiol-disulfide isomerase/thioredoxin